MKKFIFLLLFLLFAQITVCAEDFPPSGVGISVTKETNPIYWGYLEDYGAKLKSALEKSHMFRLRGFGTAYDFYLTRDGQIKYMRLSLSQNKRYDENIKKIILSVDPLPFRDGMNLDEMVFSVYMGYENYDSIDISIGKSLKNNEKIFHIMITTTK